MKWVSSSAFKDKEKVTGMQCSKCKANDMYRIRREGFLRMRVFPLFGYYPWKCRQCQSIQMARKRGDRKQKLREAQQQ
jgi:hypothetical protein